MRRRDFNLNLLGFQAVGAIYNTARAEMIPRQNVHVALGAVVMVSLALTIVTFPVVLIWFGQPIGNTAAKTADVSAAVFMWRFSQHSLSRRSSNVRATVHDVTIRN